MALDDLQFRASDHNHVYHVFNIISMFSTSFQISHISVFTHVQETLFFHSFHSQMKILVSHSCMPQIFAAYLCFLPHDPMRWVSRLLANNNDREEPCIPRGAIGDTSHFRRALLWRRRLKNWLVSPIAPRGMHGSSLSLLFASNLLTHRIGSERMGMPRYEEILTERQLVTLFSHMTVGVKKKSGQNKWSHWFRIRSAYVPYLQGLYRVPPANKIIYIILLAYFWKVQVCYFTNILYLDYVSRKSWLFRSVAF